MRNSAKANVLCKFERAEMKEYQETVQKALKLLDKKNLSIIMHGASFPSIPSEDTGIGSPNSNGARVFANFIKGVFNSIQLGPGGKTKFVDASPYTGTIFSNNTLFIDLAQLTEPKWENILSDETFKRIVENNPNKGKNKTAYEYIYTEQEKALREAYKNFRIKIDKLKKINDKFSKFRAENNFWLEKDAIYEALSIKHGNDYWPVWKDEIDKNLFSLKNDATQERIAEIKRDYSEEIEFYSFCQFVADVQKEEMKEYVLEHGIKLIADRQVGFSDRDVWSNQSLFLSGWSLGCPPDYFSETGQAWGFPVMDPDKIFNPDGSIGEGGELFKAIFKKIFKENPGGVRIDHIIGLVDPWVYKAGKKPMPEEGAGRLYSSPENEKLAKYSHISIKDLMEDSEPEDEDRVARLSREQIDSYAEFLNKIVIQAAKEEGLDKNAIICEDLGTLTAPVELVLGDLKLSGVRVTQFVDPEDLEHPYRGVLVGKNHWIMVGTHDNVPLSLWAKNLTAEETLLHAQNLAEDLIPETDKREAFIEKLTNNPEELVKAKYAELFSSPAQNLQFFFSDFFGLEEVYNKPGTSGSQNWSLRLPNDFEEFYYSQLSKGKGLNLPETLKTAIESKGQKFAQKNKDLLNKLEEYSKILRIT